MICFAILHVQSSLACSMLLMTVLVDLMREKTMMRMLCMEAWQVDK